MESLISFLPKKTYGIVAGYCDNELIALVAGVNINNDNTLDLEFPKSNPFDLNQKITIHLDDRTGVEEFTSTLQVHRCSYKGIISKKEDYKLTVFPEEYVIQYAGNRIAYKSPDYEYPDQSKKIGAPLEASRVTGKLIPNSEDHENKVGVLITGAVDRPHTTVMAFLSGKNDEIYIISHRDSFKSGLLHRDSFCMFAIDHRSTYHFERKYEWNYTIIKSKAKIVEKSDKNFAEVQALFIDKNPWEIVFFSAPSIEMFHLEALEIIYADKY